LKTLFVYVDESGNFDFTSGGTRHLVLSVFCTTIPAANTRSLSRIKYSFMNQGIDLANFHASEDLQTVRDRVFKAIASLDASNARAFWIAKQKPEFLSLGVVEIYKTFGWHIAQYVRDVTSGLGVAKVVLVFDKALVRQDQNAVLAAIKPQLATLRVQYHVYFHNVSKDFNGQISDYLAWARYVALERGETRPLDALPFHLKEVCEIRSASLKG